MTAAEHAAQRNAVKASLLCDEQRQHRHDAPARAPKVVPGELGTTNLSYEGEPTRVHARQPEETRRAGWAAGSTRPDALLADCGVCVLIPDSDPMTGQYDLIEQASCPTHGWDQHPVMRTVPGTPRIV